MKYLFLFILICPIQLFSINEPVKIVETSHSLHMKFDQKETFQEFYSQTQKFLNLNYQNVNYEDFSIENLCEGDFVLLGI